MKLVGSTAGEFVGETVGSVLGSQELSSSSPTLKAGSRLARVGVKSYTTVLGAVGGVTKDITKAAKDGAVNVLTHVAGEDVGNIVKQTSGTSKLPLALVILKLPPSIPKIISASFWHRACSNNFNRDW